VTKASPADLRSRLERAVLARAAGAARVRHGDFPAILAAHTSRSIRQLAVAAGFDSVLTRSSPPVAQLMVRQVVSACYPIPPAAKKGVLRGHIAASNLTFPARKGAAIANPTEGKPGMTGRVLLLSPSRGLGGGIERYVGTVEWAFATQGVECRRLDLSGSGGRAHARLLAQGRVVLRGEREPTRLVVAHRALLPVAALLARDSAVCGVSVVCYGSDVWGSRWRPRRYLERRLMRGAGVRVVACSNFTAGALMRDCRATVLLPALSREWFDTLAAAAAGRPDRGTGIRLATAFRLADWRMKGLPQLVEAVTALGRPDVCLTICGSGNPPSDLLRLVSEYPWCVLRPGLSDDDLARELAAADLFVLATRSGCGVVGEGFGLVLLEAQAAGTPVIAPAYGGSHEAYIEGVTGVAPADESVEALTRTLDDLLKDPARLAWMGGHAVEWTRQAFDPERYAQLTARRLL
jgi:phosphatidylinositol alpha-1,6-mannosyltransferase